MLNPYEVFSYLNESDEEHDECSAELCFKLKSSESGFKHNCFGVSFDDLEDDYEFGRFGRRTS